MTNRLLSINLCLRRTLALGAALFLEPLGLPLPLFAIGACSSSEDFADSLALVGAGGRPRFLESPLGS